MAVVASGFFSVSFKYRDFARPTARTSSHVGAPADSAAVIRATLAHNNSSAMIKLRMGKMLFESAGGG
jgi:hypothetical protein